MKKIINQGDQVVSEAFSGLMKAFAKDYERIGDNTAFLYRGRRKGVSLVIGGGSGHEPLFGGFCGQGLADAVVSGNIFAAPNPLSILETAQAVDNGKGVLFLYGNYAGDNLNFDMAEEMCADEGIQTAHLRVWDDIASAPRERADERRGIAGDVFVIKIAAAACDAGLSLEEVVRVASRARDRIASIGVATRPGSIPGLDKPTFELPEDMLEYGMGLHGEPGIERTKMAPADQLTERMYAELKREMGFESGCEMAVLINGLGSTTMIEMYIVANRLCDLLAGDGVKVYDFRIGSYCTCQEMGGFSITLLPMDEELKGYYDAPCYSPFYAMRGGMGR